MTAPLNSDLVERLAKVLENQEYYWMETPDVVRAVLAEIEAMGLVMVPQTGDWEEERTP